MATARITIRLPQSLLDAADKAAGGDIAAYVRGLISEATGVPVDPMPRGVAALSDARRSEIGEQAAAARWGRKKSAKKQRRKST